MARSRASFGGLHFYGERYSFLLYAKNKLYEEISQQYKIKGGHKQFWGEFLSECPPPAVATGLHHGVVLIAQKRIGLSAACSASLAGLSAACSVSLAVNSASRVDNFASKALGLKQTDPATGGGLLT